MFAWIKNLFSRLGGVLHLAATAMGSGVSLGTLAAWALKYGPLIAAVIEFVEQRKTEEEQHQAATDFERGFRVLTQTKNPKALEDAIRSRCGPDGCMLP